MRTEGTGEVACIGGLQFFSGYGKEEQSLSWQVKTFA